MSSSSTTFSIDQTAKRLGVSVRTVRRWIKAGQLAGVNLGAGEQRPTYRVTEAALIRFLRSRKVKT